jgi:hypothetical protein
MVRDRARWLDEDGDLQVFVPGLMATGILVSICMLIWDGVKRFVPDLGARRRAARLRMHTTGRVNDLASIERGMPPAPMQVERVSRGRGRSLLLAIGALAAAGVSGFLTIAAYSTPGGSFSGRGWTLSMGLSLAGICAAFGTTWLCVALSDQENERAWLARARTRWPIGVLPSPDESDA